MVARSKRKSRTSRRGATLRSNRNSNRRRYRGQRRFKGTEPCNERVYKGLTANEFGLGQAILQILEALEKIHDAPQLKSGLIPPINAMLQYLAEKSVYDEVELSDVMDVTALKQMAREILDSDASAEPQLIVNQSTHEGYVEQPRAGYTEEINVGEMEIAQSQEELLLVTALVTAEKPNPGLDWTNSVLRVQHRSSDGSPTDEFLTSNEYDNFITVIESGKNYQLETKPFHIPKRLWSSGFINIRIKEKPPSYEHLKMVIHLDGMRDPGMLSRKGL